MKDYIFGLINEIYLNLYFFFKYFSSSLMTEIFNYLKIKFINITLHFDIFINYYFFSIYLLFIIILTHYIYKLTYSFSYYLIYNFIHNTYSHLQHVKHFIILNKFETRFLTYYKNLFSINLKQFLVGTGILIFYLLSYLIFIVLIEFFNSVNFIFITNKIYNVYSYNFCNNIDFYFQFNYINIFFILIIIYIFLHILFGLFNIFYDYLKDISFILFFLSFFIFLFLFSLFLLHTNLELYNYIIPN
jgi:hypothetical protein